MEIPLTQSKHAIIDEADYELISKYSWYAIKKCNNWYAQTYVSGKCSKMMYMHRLLCGDRCNGRQVDHKNHNGLDNRRVNIRICGPRENQCNQIPRKGQSKYKGVGKHCGKWRARIMNKGEEIYIGHFETEEEAALAYNNAALKYFGEFACLNQIRGE